MKSDVTENMAILHSTQQMQMIKRIISPIIEFYGNVTKSLVEYSTYDN